jgi:hypothetical protein
MQGTPCHHLSFSCKNLLVNTKALHGLLGWVLGSPVLWSLHRGEVKPGEDGEDDYGPFEVHSHLSFCLQS